MEKKANMKFLIKEIRSKTGELHFQRYRILETPWFNIYLHYIAKSDEDRDPHNHPWSFRSLILRGGYAEWIWEGDETKLLVDRRVYRPGSVAVSLSQKLYHKIVLDKPTWTLVLTGRRHEKPWGYLTEDGFVDFETYRKRKNNV